MGVCHYGEDSPELVLSSNPVVEIGSLTLEHSADDVEDAEMRAHFYVDVPAVVVLRKDEAARAILQKVEPAHVISLEVDVLALGYDLLLEQGAYPSNECRGLFLEKGDVGIGFLVQVNAHVDLQFVGQVLQEVVQVLSFLALVEPERLLYSRVKVVGQVILLLNVV